MVGTWLVVLCAVAAAAMIVQAWRAWLWHHRGGGARMARLEYARMRRDRTDSAEARLTEAEFIRYFTGSRPRPARYIIAAALLLVFGLPIAWALARGWPWN